MKEPYYHYLHMICPPTLKIQENRQAYFQNITEFLKVAGHKLKITPKSQYLQLEKVIELLKKIKFLVLITSQVPKDFFSYNELCQSFMEIIINFFELYERRLEKYRDIIFRIRNKNIVTQIFFYSALYDVIYSIIKL